MTRRDALDRRCCAGSRRSPRSREAHPIKVNAVAMRGFTEDEVLPFARFAREHPYEVRFIEFMPLDADHAWSPRRRADRRGGPRRDRRRLPARAGAARAVLDRPRLPLRRRTGTDRLHQPGLGAVLRRLQPDPRDRRRPAADLPLLAARDRPARRRCAAAPTTTSSSRRSATRSGARSSSTTSATPASCSPRARCRRSAGSGPGRSRAAATGSADQPRDAGDVPVVVHGRQAGVRVPQVVLEERDRDLLHDAEIGLLRRVRGKMGRADQRQQELRPRREPRSTGASRRGR